MSPISQIQKSSLDFAPLGHLAPDTGRRTIDVLQFAFSIWRPLAIGLGSGILLGILAYLYLGPAYQADTRILVSEKSGLPSGDKTIATMGDREQHVDLIKSDPIIFRALQDHGLAKLPAFESSGDAIEEIADRMSVRRSAGRDNSQDNIFDISFIHPDKETTVLVVDAIVAAYRDYLLDRRTKNMGDLTETLGDKIAQLDLQIGTLEKAHYDWLGKQPPIFRNSMVVTKEGQTMTMPNQYQLELDRIRKLILDNRLSQDDVRSKLFTLDEMLQAKTSRESIEFWIMHSLSATSSGGGGESGGSGGSGGASMFTGPPGKSELDNQLLTARILKARLLNLVGRDHEDVIKIDRQITTILNAYREQGVAAPVVDELPGEVATGTVRPSNKTVDLPGIYRYTLNSQLQFLGNQQASLLAQDVSATENARNASLLELQDQKFKDDISERKLERKGIVDEAVQFRKLKEQDGFTVEPLAQVRVSKSLKRLLKIIGVCGILGVLAVFGLAYFREWFDTTLKSLEEIRRNVSAQLMGAVPHLAGLGSTDGLSDGTKLDAALCYFHRPGSREAEAYRSIRTTLFMSTRDSGDKVIQVSSAEPGDGKTTTICNLAIAIARSGKSVLLLDADLRRPSVHRTFGLPLEVGLANTLHRETEWRNAVRHTRIDGLDVLTAGYCSGNPAELLSMASLSQLLRDARIHYDYILIDSPPLLAVSDPCIVSPHVDGLLLVVRAHKNKRDVVRRAHEILDTHGIRLYGAIANDVEEAAEAEGNYKEYYYPESQPKATSAPTQDSYATPAGRTSKI